jgi:iron complex outermembrane recepter protein
MKKINLLTLSVCASLSCLSASAEESTNENTADALPVILVEGKKIKQVSVNEVKSADLAEALTKKVPNISLVRRSGIANDIILRGQKKDNINILIDNAKIHGACPNRMDPPTSHILTNNIEDVEITEGPYDVENFGTLSGAIKVTTKKPEAGFRGEVNLNLGSWDYQKFAATLSGGNEKVRAMLSFSEETGGQYEDGDGNNFSEQITANNVSPMMNYKPEYDDHDAYKKSTMMAKLFATVADNQELEISYTANRSDDIFYPSTPMDAIYDDSDIFNINYSLMDLGDYSSKLEIQAYDSKVDHPMSTYYRVSSGTDAVNEKISQLETHSSGIKIINTTDLSAMSDIKYGIDINTRNWDGEYTGFGTAAMMTGIVSIPDVDTENKALFVKYDGDLSDNVNLKMGMRYDDTEITNNDASLQGNDYTAVSAFIFSSYQMNEQHRLFGGLGKASRVPDARELYFRSSMMGGMLIGNPELDDTTNTELDLGVESKVGDLSMKSKIFYSKLSDYIYFNSSKPMKKFENIDATIYGLDLSGQYKINTSFDVDFGLALQKGSKDDPLAGQTDKDLAEVPPMKISSALNYHYQQDSSVMVEVISASSWDDYDADNGEQELDSWTVMNLKLKHRFNNHFGLTFGIDNVFDKTYAVSNTYKDLTLLADGTGDVMLINEPGRYVYINGTYSF